MKKSKYTFVEFIAATEGEDFDKLEEHWILWAKKFVTSFGTNEIHNGDCQNLPCPCYLCIMEQYLSDYYKFVFHEEEFRKELGEYSE